MSDAHVTPEWLVGLLRNDRDRWKAEAMASRLLLDKVRVLLDFINSGDVIIMMSTVRKQDEFNTLLQKIGEHLSREAGDED